MTIKKIKIFLASSGELKDEREKFELFISRENKKYINDNIFLELIIWEDLKASFNGKRIQNYFNNELLKCEVVIALFGTKVGQFTEEEFDIAYKAFKNGKNPKYLYVYFKDINININNITDETLKIKKLKEKIQIYEQMYNSYTNIDSLILKLKLQLDKIIPEIIKTKNKKIITSKDNKLSKSRFKTSALLLKHEQKIKKQFEALIKYNRKNYLREEIIVRDMYRVKEYPDIIEREGDVCSSWFKVGFAGLYHGGIKLVLGGFVECLVKTKMGYIKTKNSTDENCIRVHLISEILFEDIVSLDKEGDEIYSFPHVFCYFNKDGCPHNRLYYAEQFELNGHYHYSEICKFEDVLLDDNQ